jgi:hypothetical protein
MRLASRSLWQARFVLIGKGCLDFEPFRQGRGVEVAGRAEPREQPPWMPGITAHLPI